MANTLEYSKIFTQNLDKAMLQNLSSGAMELNANMVKYTGGNEIKIPKMVVNGLSNYDRTAASAFPSDGAVTLSWETFSFDKDRAQTFILDSQDVDETNFVATAGNILGEFQRTQVVPEIDAYRFSKIFSVINPRLRTGAYTVSSANVYTQLKNDLKRIQSVIGESEPLTIYASYEAMDALDKSSEIDHALSMMDFASGGLTTKVKSFDGVPIIKVPSTRFKTAFTFGAPGFSVSALGMTINWLITPNRAAIAVTKAEKLRIFTPDQNQDADGWKIQYRRYHTLIVPDNKADTMWMSYEAIAAPALTATVDAGTAAGTKFTATAGTGNTLAYILGTASPGVKYNDLLSAYSTAVSPYTSGADIATAVATNILTMLEVDASGHIVKAKEVTLAAGDIFA